MFLPRPKVDSALVAIRRRPVPAGPPSVPPEELFALVRAGFGQRRKTLRRSLHGLVTEDDFLAADVDAGRAPNSSMSTPGAASRWLSTTGAETALIMAGSSLPMSMRAPAKLTLTLRIIGVRADGYHLLDAEMVTLTLADELTFAEGDRADRRRTAGRRRPGRRLEPRAPSAAHWSVDEPPSTWRSSSRPVGGLGGGSADAAAVLRWAGVTDLEAAATLGADVPFCVVGGRARVRGIGEVVEPLPPMARSFTLVTPPLALSTPEVYRAWDDLGGPD